MTSTVVFNVTQGDATTAVASPSGLPAGLTRFAIIAADGSIVNTQDVAGLSATFTGVADGDFTGSAQLLDTAGALLGSPVTQAFVDGVAVTPPAATFQPLVSLSITVTPEPVVPAAPAA
jgi:hypothetical protein